MVKIRDVKITLINGNSTIMIRTEFFNWLRAWSPSKNWEIILQECEDANFKE